MKLATNDMPDLRRDGQPDAVYNTGVTFFRAARHAHDGATAQRPSGGGGAHDGAGAGFGRAWRFAIEWANRTLMTGVIGNDQTEFNRLLRNRYLDGDYGCNRPECLAPDPMLYVPARARFGCDDALESRGSGGGGGGGGGGGSGCEPCGWYAEPSMRDEYTGLGAVDARREMQAWSQCEREHLTNRKAAVRPARRVHWMWGGRVRFGLLPLDRFLQGAIE